MWYDSTTLIFFVILCPIVSWYEDGLKVPTPEVIAHSLPVSDVDFYVMLKWWYWEMFYKVDYCSDYWHKYTVCVDC